MEITIAKTYKNELQKKIAELLKEYEKMTGLEISKLSLVRQTQTGALGVEVSFNYSVDAEIRI